MTRARTLADMISDGVIGTTELADDAITPVKLDETGNYTIAQLGVNGTVTADGLTVDGSGTAQITSTSATTLELIRSGSAGQISSFVMKDGGNAQNRINSSGGSLEFEYGASNLNALKIDNNGDINFYASNGTTPKFFWDASAESLGIGTSSPAYALTVETDADTWASRIYNTGSDANAAGLLVRSDATAAHNATVLGVYADSGYKFVVKSTGNVGIGLTSNISSKLHVNSEVSLGPDNNNRMIVGSTSGGVGSIGTIQGGTASFSTMTFNSGQVGIGTSVPEALLDLAYNLPDDTNGIIRPLKIRTTDTSNETDLLAGDGVGLLFEIPSNPISGATSQIGAAIDALKGESSDANSSTVLSFKTSANNETLNEAMRINSTGAVTMPSQPMFHATQSGDRTVGVSEVKLAFDGTDINVGGHFSTSNDRFTAPVGGKYFLSFNGTIKNMSSTGTYLAVYFKKNGSGTSHRFRTRAENVGNEYTGIQGTAILSLSSGDYIEVYGYNESGSFKLAANEHHFSGFLIG